MSPWSNQNDPASAGDASKAENPQENPVENFCEIFYKYLSQRKNKYSKSRGRMTLLSCTIGLRSPVEHHGNVFPVVGDLKIHTCSISDEDEVESDQSINVHLIS